jgi:hypothetical protein
MTPYYDFDHRSPPQFFSDALRRFTGEPAKNVQRLLSETFPHRIADHAGTATMLDADGIPRTVYVMQPYGVDGAMLAHCENFAKRTGLSFAVSAASEHNPGKTFSLIFAKHEIVWPQSVPAVLLT